MGFGVSVGAGASGAFGGSSASAWEERGLFRKRKRLIAATAPRAVECLITGDLIRRISLNEKERKGASFRVTWKPATRAPLYLLRKTAFHETRRCPEGAPTAPGPFPVRARRTPSRERPRSGPRMRRPSRSRNRSPGCRYGDRRGGRCDARSRSRHVRSCPTSTRRRPGGGAVPPTALDRVDPRRR